MNMEESVFEGAAGNKTTIRIVEKLDGNYELYCVTDDDEKFKFISDAEVELNYNPEAINLRLEYDSSWSDAVREERIAREIKVLEDRGNRVVEYLPSRDYDEDELTHGDDARWMQIYTEDRDDLLDFIHTTDFYVDE
jgi:hypothetical protein